MKLDAFPHIFLFLIFLQKKQKQGIKKMVFGKTKNIFQQEKSSRDTLILSPSVCLRRF